MARTVSATHVNSHHTLLTDAWVEDVQILEKGIHAFAVTPANDYHVALF